MMMLNMLTAWYSCQVFQCTLLIGLMGCSPPWVPMVDGFIGRTSKGGGGGAKIQSSPKRAFLIFTHYNPHKSGRESRVVCSICKALKILKYYIS